MKDELVKIEITLSSHNDVIEIDYTIEEWEGMTWQEQQSAIEEAIDAENENNRPYWVHSKTITND
jgi:hypothetical protein